MKKLIIFLYIVLLCAIPIQAQRGEYYFDSDPGTGKGIRVSVTSTADNYEWTSNVPTTGLSLGYHRLFYRFCDNAGRWGLTENKLFYVYDTKSPIIVVPPNSPIVAMEYFYDKDPGIGKGIVVPSFNPDDSVTVTMPISISSLSIGNHSVNFRIKDALGRWSQHSTLSLKITDNTGAEQPDNLNEVIGYPNPTTGIVHLATQNLLDTRIRICVYNNSGKMIQSLDQVNNPSGTVINLEKNPEGLYFIRIDDNQTNYQLKVIKK